MPEAGRLEKRILAIGAAGEFLQLLNAGADIQQLKEKIHKLVEGGHSVPGSVEMKLFALELHGHLRGLKNTELTASTTKLAAALNPYSPRPPLPAEGPATAWLTFSGMALPHQEKMDYLHRVLGRDVFGILLKEGEDMGDVTYNLCQAMEKSLEASVEDLEDVPRVITDWLTVARGLRSILGYDDTDVDFEAVQEMKMASTVDGESLLVDVASLALRNGWYAEMVDEFIRTMPDSRKLLPEFASANKMLELTFRDEHLWALKDAIQLVERARPLLRSGATRKLSVECQGCLFSMSKAMMAEGQGPDASWRGLELDDETIQLKVAELFQLACTVWGDSADLLKAAKNVEAKVAHNKAASTIKALKIAMDHASLTDMAEGSMTKVLEAATFCRGMELSPAENSFVSDFGQSYLAKLKKDNLKLEASSKASVCLQELAELAPTEKALQLGTLKFKTVHDLAGSIDELRTLADTIEGCVEADARREGIGKVLRCHAALKDLEKDASANEEDPDQFLAAALEEGNSFIAEVRDCMVSASDNRFKKLTESLKLTASGTTDGGDWHTALPDSPEMDAIILQARETLMALKPAEYDASRDRLLAAHADWQEVRGIFALAMTEEAKAMAEEATKVQRRLAVSYVEGLLIALFSKPDTDRVCLKKKVQSVKKKLGEDCWPLVYIGLQKRCTDALRLK